LASLASQNGIKSSSIEIVIVDNNSTDDTSETLERFRESLPIRHMKESQQGLAYARNRAAAESKGEVLLFTDDDVRLEQGWLAAYQEAIERFPNVEFFGGRILPDWGGRKPGWIGNEPLALIDGLLVWFDHGTETRLFEATEPLPFGASFAVRKTLLEKVGLFRVDLGTGGTGLGRGEETELLMRARSAGLQGVYVGETLCFHVVDRKRLRMRGLYNYGVVSGKSQNAMGAWVDGRYSVAVSFLLRGSYHFLKGRRDLFRQCVINAGIQVGTRPDFRGRKAKLKLLSNRGNGLG
jgi:glycosyltransferase involved in cell wall biosynthesis